MAKQIVENFGLTKQELTSVYRRGQTFRAALLLGVFAGAAYAISTPFGPLAFIAVPATAFFVIRRGLAARAWYENRLATGRWQVTGYMLPEHRNPPKKKKWWQRTAKLAVPVAAVPQAETPQPPASPAPPMAAAPATPA